MVYRLIEYLFWYRKKQITYTYDALMIYTLIAI